MQRGAEDLLGLSEDFLRESLGTVVLYAAVRGKYVRERVKGLSKLHAISYF
jgi:hypothetical protein